MDANARCDECFCHAFVVAHADLIQPLKADLKGRVMREEGDVLALCFGGCQLRVQPFEPRVAIGAEMCITDEGWAELRVDGEDARVAVYEGVLDKSVGIYSGPRKGRGEVVTLIVVAAHDGDGFVTGFEYFGKAGVFLGRARIREVAHQDHTLCIGMMIKRVRQCAFEIFIGVDADDGLANRLDVNVGEGEKFCHISALLKFDQQVFGVYLAARRGVDGFDGAVGFRIDARFHFHGLDCQKHIA